jgi:hypothetical protein
MSEYSYSQDTLLTAISDAAKNGVLSENNRLIALLVSQGLIWHAPESDADAGYTKGDWVCVKGFYKGSPMLGRVHGLELS